VGLQQRNAFSLAIYDYFLRALRVIVSRPQGVEIHLAVIKLLLPVYCEHGDILAARKNSKLCFLVEE